MYRDVAKSWLLANEKLSPAEISLEKRLGVILELHKPEKPAGHVNEPAKCFLTYTPTDR